MTALDTVIRGGLVVDGTGAPGARADVGIADGRIVEIGDVDGSADRTIDADGLVVAPGFVDPHTHYDAQLFWDPLATPSSWHGVTSVVGGNCGFTLAPLLPRDADYTRAMMAQVEGMPLAALEQGVPWGWRTFGEYLGSLDGGIAVNAGFMVGHCALRRYVLGEDFTRVATDDELDAIAQLCDESMAAGGLGLSTTRSSTHVDADGEAVPSRWASEAEVLRLCEIVGNYEGTSLELISEGCLNGFTDDEATFLTAMTATANRAMNWNVLNVTAAQSDRVWNQVELSRRAREGGGRIVALTMPMAFDLNMSFGSFCALWLINGWRDILNVDVPERIRRLRDPEVRAQMLELAKDSPKLGRYADFSKFQIGEIYSEANAPYLHRIVGDIAAEQGKDPFETIVDIVAADDLRTVLWPLPANEGDDDWALRREIWDEPDILIGGSDAGAHLDRLLGSVYPTRFLADSIRGRQVVSMERAVHMMTDVPARLFGLRERGRVATGYHADLALFDPETVTSSPAKTVYDLPGETKRLIAEPTGVQHVFVNGTEIVTEGASTGATPGVVLRSGRDTHGTNVR